MIIPIHCMRLNPVPFGLIWDGRKGIELRLYDEKNDNDVRNARRDCAAREII